RYALGLREVQCDRELVRVQHGEVLRAVDPTGRVRREPERAQEVGTLLRLDADHGRAVVGEVAGRDGSRGAAAALEDRGAGGERAHTTPSARSRASSAASTPTSDRTSAVCSPRRGAARRTAIAVAAASVDVVRAKPPGSRRAPRPGCATSTKKSRAA